MSYKYKYRDTFWHEGKRYDIKARTQKELIEKVGNKKAQLESNILDSNTTVKQWADKWLKQKETTVSQTWFKTIKSIVENKIVPNLNLPIKNVLPIHIEGVLAQYTHHTDSHIKKIYDIMNEMFRSALNNRLIDYNPVPGATKPKGKKNQKRRAITDYERKHILKVAEKYEKSKLFIFLMLYAGLRPQEVITLQWRHIDFKGRFIRVESALKRDGTEGGPKSDAGERKIPLSSVLSSELIKHRGEPFSYVCTQSSGKRHTRTSVRQMWVSFERRLNISMGCKTFKGKVLPPYRVADDLVMYCLRHTYCTDLQDKGIPINLAREYMGHEDIRVTSAIYTHQSDESFANALKLIDKDVENGVETNAVTVGK